MFHKHKFGYIEYWSHNKGFFTPLPALTAMDFTMIRLYQAPLVGLISQFCGPYVLLYSECGQSISWLLTSGDSLSPPASSSNSQRNALNGKCLFKNFKNMNSWSWTTFHSRSYMLYAMEWPTDATMCSEFIFLQVHSTCFGRYTRPSSGVQV